ncbi:MAG: zf-TFIIB domain-containing protein [Rubrivivax sp.]|jgi:hypothetical protein|nr:zf-TFIIB domain-containing protein [Rubrivivax sp.]
MLAARPTATWPCPRCAAPMAPLRPAGRQTTPVDHCAACALVWFDPLEFDGLDRAGWVSLLMDTLATGAPEPGLGSADWRCPRCDSALQARPLAGAHGRHTAMACPAGHGQAHGVAALLASRGLLQPLGLAERLLLQQREGGLACMSCGAPLSAHDEACGHCGSPLLGVDVPRLAQALGATGGKALGGKARGDGPEPWRWGCHGCGRVIDPSADATCPQCGSPAQAPRLADLEPLLAQARRRLDDEQGRAMREALADMSDPERHRVAAATGRPEHRAASQRAERRWWQRWGLIAAAFGLALALALCSGGCAT